MSDIENKKCFVISPIGEDASDTRKRADQVLKHIIKPAALLAGYVAERADEIDKPGLITSQVIQRVVSDPLVIADLTEMNPNVFYELAIRHAFRKPLVQIIQKGERIPFDVAGTRTIHVDHRDLDSVASAKEEIVKQIKSLEDDPSDIETPISVSLDLQDLRQSDNPEDRSLAEILSELSDIRVIIAKMHETGIVGRDDELRKLRNYVTELTERSEARLPLRYKNIERTLYQISEFNAFDDQDPEKALERAISYSVLASAYKDRLPWIYEGGMEVYRQIIFGTKAKAQEAEVRFAKLVRASFDSPMIRDLMEGDKAGYMLMDLLHRFAR